MLSSPSHHESPTQWWLLLVPLVVALVGGAAVWSTTPQPAVYEQMSTDSVVQRYLEQTHAPAAAVAVVGGSRVEVVARGKSVNDESITPDTPIRIASLTKTFTATLAQLLAREGVIGLDRPIVSYLPDLSLSDSRFLAITMRQLLTHRSGLADRTIDVPALGLSTSSTDFVERLGGASLDAAPGTQFRYCNANYNLAVAVIERATGRAFGNLLRDRLLEPLGMTSTSVIGPDTGQGTGWNELLGYWFTAQEPEGYGPGSGGLVSTAHDMGLWMSAQVGNFPQVVPPDVLAAVQNPSPGDEYAMGWSEDTSGARVNSGNLFTSTSAQLARPETKSAVVVLMNSASMVDMAYPLMQALDHTRTAGPHHGPFSIADSLSVLNRSAVAVLCVIVSACGVGLVRSSQWRRRNAERARTHRLLRSVWLLTPLLLLVGLRHIAELLTGGRSVRWIEILHLTPAVVLVVATAAVCGCVVVAARAR